MQEETKFDRPCMLCLGIRCSFIKEVYLTNFDSVMSPMTAYMDGIELTNNAVLNETESLLFGCLLQ